MPANMKSILGADTAFQLFNKALIQMDARLARIANQMMMMFARLDQLIAFLAVAQVHRLYQRVLRQRLERPVNSRQPRRLVIAAPHQTVNILGAQQIGGGLQDLENLLTTLRQSHALLTTPGDFLQIRPQLLA